MAFITPHAIAFVAVLAFHAGTALAMRDGNPGAPSIDAPVDEATLPKQHRVPDDVVFRIVKSLSGKDLATFSARHVRWALEDNLGYPRNSLWSERSKVVQALAPIIEIIKDDRKKRVNIAGKACSGTSESTWNPGTWYQGTCNDYETSCIKADGEFALDGQEGKCYVAHKRRCRQQDPGDGTSGACVAGYTCRGFWTWSLGGSVGTVGDPGHTGASSLKLYGFCVNPNGSEDTLEWKSFRWHMSSAAYSGTRAYTTD